MDINKARLTLPEEDEHTYYDYLGFYKQYVKGLRLRKFPHYVGFCPFHNDMNTPNFDINIETGSYLCRACGARGYYTTFAIREENGTTIINTPDILVNPQDIERLKEERKKSKINPDMERALDKRLAQNAHEFLMKQPVMLQHVLAHRGLTEKTLVDYQIGVIEGVLTIPIFDRDGNFYALKRHKWFQTEGAYELQIYPWIAVTNRQYAYVIICEGEFDCLVLRQYGMNACTATQGANAWDTGLNKYFEGKFVYLAYDNDEAGRKATESMVRLLGTTINKRIINWPDWLDKDITDWFVKYKRTVSEFHTLLKYAKAA